MNQKKMRQYHQVQREIADKKVWFKLYKAGTKWLVAGIAAGSLGLSMVTMQAFADTSANTVTTVSNQSTTQAAGPQPTNSPTTDTGNSTAEVSTVSNQEVPATDFLSESTAATDQTASSPEAASTSAETTPVTVKPSSFSSSTNSSVSKSVKESTSTVAASSPDNSTPSVTPTATPQSPITPSPKALAVSNPPYVVNPKAVDITNLGDKTSDNYNSVLLEENTPPITTSDGQHVFVLKTENATDAEIASMQQTIANNHGFNPTYNITATNTRLINGQLTLTRSSEFEVSVPVQNVQYAQNTSPLFFQIRIYAVLKDGTVNQVDSSTWNSRISTSRSSEENNMVPNGLSDLDNNGRMRINYSVDQGISLQKVIDASSTSNPDFKFEDITGFAVNLSYEAMYSYNDEPFVDSSTADGSPRSMSNYLTNVYQFNILQLTPTVENRSDVINGTGTMVGDNITVQTPDGSKTVTTTVDENGNWSVDGHLFNDDDTVVIVETNNFGDTPGAVIAPQKAIATRTISYVDPQDQKLTGSFVQTLNVSRTGTGTYANGTMSNITYNDWAANNQFAASNNPVISGYVTANSTVPAAQFDPATLSAEVAVHYDPVGSYRLAGNPQVPAPIFYPNALTDSTKVDVTAVTLPYLPGYVAVMGNTPLTLRDPAHPATGYLAPQPVDPLQDTPIIYQAQSQSAEIHYRDITDTSQPQSLSVVSLTGPSDSVSPYSPAATITSYENKGYKFISSTYPTSGLIFDSDTTTAQVYSVDFIRGTAVITPQAPGNPGEPVDPDNPGGVKWPVGSDHVADLTQTAYRTITYLNENGNLIAPTHSDQISFSSYATVDLVTGAITPSNRWTITSTNSDGSADTTFPAVKNPVIMGYYTAVSQVPEIAGLTHTSEDVTVTVTYRKLSQWVPNDSELPAIDYPNDPDNASSILPLNDPASPVIAYVPGMTPTGPDSEVLQPKDPTDITQGFIPPVPQNLGQPTLINYVGNPQQARVIYQDIQVPDEPLIIGTPIILAGKSGETSSYQTAGRITELITQGYLLQNDGYPSNGMIFDYLDGNVQDFIVTFTHATATITPEKPGKPGESITPGQPGPKWPVGSDDVTVLKKVVMETINYVDLSSNPIAQQHQDQVSFTRDAAVDLVTGTITPRPSWSATNNDTTFDRVISPVVSGYFTSQPLIPAVTGLTSNSANVSEQVVYQKLGHWIITGSSINPIQYPNDPVNPAGILAVTDPQAPVVPYVSGKLPQGPDGITLTPRNLAVAAEGYLPPVPIDLAADTIITYVNDGSGTPDPGGSTPGGTVPTPNPGGSSTGTPPVENVPGTTPSTEPPQNKPGTGGPTSQPPQTEPPAAPANQPKRGSVINPQVKQGPLTSPQIKQGDPITASSIKAGQALTTAQAKQPIPANSGTQQSLPQTNESAAIWVQIGAILLGILTWLGFRNKRHPGDE